MAESNTRTSRAPQERIRVIDELERIWRNLDEPMERRKKARKAWDALTAAPLRSYGNPATFVGDGKRPSAPRPVSTHRNDEVKSRGVV